MIKNKRTKNIFASDPPTLSKKYTEDNTKPRSSKLSQLMATKKVTNASPERKMRISRPNIFAGNEDSSPVKKETIIGDSSSDEAEKLKVNIIKQERDSYSRSSNKHSIGAKEGVVNATQFDVATLVNFNEALIKYSNDGFKNKSENKSISKDDDFQAGKRKNLFTNSTQKPTTSLKKLIFKETVIGDADGDDEPKNKPISIFRESVNKRKGTIVVESIEEDSADISQDLPETITSTIYESIVNQMIVSIMNSSFSDIRIRTNLETSTDNIIEKAIRPMIYDIAEKSLVYAKEEEECRIREIKAHEEKMKAEADRREKERIEKLKLKELFMKQINQDSDNILDQMVDKQTFLIAQNGFNQEKHEKLINKVAVQTNDSLLNDLLPSLLSQVVQQSVSTIKSEQKFISTYSSKMVNKHANETIEMVVNDEVYKTVFECTFEAIKSDNEHANEKLINRTVEQMIHGIILDEVIPQTNLNDSINKVCKDIIREVANESIIEQKLEKSIQVQNHVSGQINGKLLYMILKMSYRSIFRTSFEEKY